MSCRHTWQCDLQSTTYYDKEAGIEEHNEDQSNASTFEATGGVNIN